MRMFFSKNKVAVAMAALIFTTAAVGAMALQAPAPDGFNPMETPEQRVMEELERLGAVPEDDDNGENHQTWPLQKEDMPSQREGTPSLPRFSDAPEVPQSDDPDAGMDSPSADSKAVPVRFGAQAAVIRPTFIRTALPFDNNKVSPKPKPKSGDEDPTDPTSRGTGPHGDHKMGKVGNLHSIPVIKMGETVQGHRGFKVIKITQ